MPIYKLALYAGIALLTVGSILFFFDTPRGILGSVDLETDKDVKAYAVARNASTHHYNDDGSLSYTFQSTKLSHYRPNSQTDESYTSVESPNVVIYNNDSPWNITSEKGHISANQIITLNDNVSLIHAEPQGGITEMNTAELILDPSQKLAYTDKPVTIVTPLGQITATGMHADMSKKNIKLLSKVKGRHQPQKFGQ